MLSKIRAPSLLAAVCAALVSACVSSPTARQAHLCANCTELHLAIPSVLGPITGFLQPSSSANQRLHVYLEGDGRPWSRWNTPSSDPNSRQLTALKLMQLDSHTAVYLNRPCYGRLPMSPACTHEHWTTGRYGEPVITAMNQALDRLAARLNATEMVLVGHSGGGTLAMLLAQRRSDVVAVVTLAANLDHRAWTDSFAFLPLTHSHNAIDVHLPPHVLRWHFAGTEDRQVPAEQTAAAAAQDELARFTLLAGIDHVCCWRKLWPDLLHKVQANLPAAPTKAPQSTGTK